MDWDLGSSIALQLNHKTVSLGLDMWTTRRLWADPGTESWTWSGLGPPQHPELSVRSKPCELPITASVQVQINGSQRLMVWMDMVIVLPAHRPRVRILHPSPFLVVCFPSSWWGTRELSLREPATDTTRSSGPSYLQQTGTSKVSYWLQLVSH